MKKEIEVAAAVIIKDGKVYAARRKKGLHLAGYWEFPGGKVETDETPEQCLYRELLEELGVRTRVGDFIGENIHDYGSKLVRLMAYEVVLLEDNLKLTDHDRSLWLSEEQMSSVEWAPADIPLLEHCRRLLIVRCGLTRRPGRGIR